MLNAYDDLSSSPGKFMEKKMADRMSDDLKRTPASSRQSFSIIAAFLPMLLAPSLSAQTEETMQKQNVVFRVVVSIIRTVAHSRSASPSFTPAAGVYLPGQQIVLDDNTSGAIIHYTVDGSAPSFSSPVYRAPLVLSTKEVIQAIAVVGNASSPATSATYSVSPPHLAFSTQPESGITNVALNPAPTVSILDENSNLVSEATNAVTLNLSVNPGKAVISGTTTLNAVHGVAQFQDLSISSGGNGYTLSRVSKGMKPATSAAFDLGSPSVTISLPSFSIAVGNTVTGTITLGLPTGAQDVHLSLTSSLANVASISPSSLAVPDGQSAGHLKLTGIGSGASALNAAGSGHSSDTAQVTTLPAAPVITPTSGSYASGHQVTMTDFVPAAAIYYTTDGSIPTTAPALYSDPIAISRAQVIQANAVQSSLSSLFASQAYQLLHVDMTVSPASATLSASQSQSFIAGLTGFSDSTVPWSLSSAIGSVSQSGLYTAPASVTTGQTVAITTTSKADPTRAVTARVSLVAPVSLSISPGSVSLASSQPQSFAAQVNGTCKTAVTWSLNPALENISASGLYTAPATILSAQIVTVIASSAHDPTKTSTANVALVPRVAITLTPGKASLLPSQTQMFSVTVADPAKTAAAKVSLVPPVSISLTPGSAMLTASQTQSFAATVTGSSNIGVIYALRPAVGSISPSGLYTAPASVAIAQTISVVATSVADAMESATASILLTPTPTLALSLPASSSGVGSTQTGTVALSVPAAKGGVSVTLATNSPSIAMPSEPSLTIAAGQSTGFFTYTTLAAGTAVFTAGANGYSSATVQVTVARPAIPASLFGLSVLNFQNISPGLQFGTTRSWDAYYFAGLDWADINTAPGVYDFFSLDQFIQLNQSRRADILYTFGRTPQWASSQPNAPSSYGPGQCAPPSDITAWDNFVTAIVTHAAGKIGYWELWNEPNSTLMYCGDILTMVTMAKHASAIIKKLDPTALLLSPGVTGGTGPEWLSTFLADGGSSAVDAISFHGYWSANAEDLLSVIASYKAAMQSNGASTKPMWDTEGSWGGFGNLEAPSTSQQVGFVAKYYLLHWSQGVSRFIWFAFDAESTPWGDLWSSNAGRTPAAVAYGETYQWMVGASLTTPCSKANNGIWTCDLTRPGGYQAEAVWISNSSATYTVDPKYPEFRDLAGVVHPVVGGKITASDQPVLLESGSIQ